MPFGAPCAKRATTSAMPITMVKSVTKVRIDDVTLIDLEGGGTLCCFESSWISVCCGTVT